MPEQIEIKLGVNAVQLVLAVALCIGLFLAGFAIGRLTEDTAAARPVADAANLTTATIGATAATAATDESDPASPVVEEDQDRFESVAGLHVESLQAEIDRLSLSEIGFVPGTSQLTTRARSTLDELAEVLVAHPFIPVEVEMFTYTEATPGENHGLSTQQADAVADYLIERGVNSGRLASVGLGSPTGPRAARSTLLLFSTENADLAAALEPVDFLAIGLDDQDQLTAVSAQILDDVGAALAANPGAEIKLVGYAYADTPTLSHDLSHELVDNAVAYLVAEGATGSRLTTVGLGDALVNIELDTMLELEVGIPAAIALGLDQLDGGRITFEPGTADLTPSGRAALDDVASVMSVDPSSTVEISVHTYSEPTSQENHDLSNLQGEAVVAALIDIGIEGDRLEMMGHGDPPHFALAGRDTYITFYPTD